jgi:hypothetical protein
MKFIAFYPFLWQVFPDVGIDPAPSLELIPEPIQHVKKIAVRMAVPVPFIDVCQQKPDKGAGDGVSHQHPDKKAQHGRGEFVNCPEEDIRRLVNAPGDLYRFHIQSLIT